MDPVTMIMTHKMLLGIRARAEAGSRRSEAGTDRV